MKRCSRNILVIAENNGSQGGFNVYLVFSGQREYLYTHRHNRMMFGMLKDGVRLANLQRGVRTMNVSAFCGRRIPAAAARHMLGSMRYLLVIIDDYIGDREQCA